MSTVTVDTGVWEHFIGQERTKRQLQVACQSAKQRGEPLSHVLLASGEPGVGKTMLARIVAAAMDTRCMEVSGKIRLNEARIALSGLERGDLLFIDEIHRLVQGGKANAEWLLHLLAEGVLMGPLGPEPQPGITIIGATTDAGRLPQTILSRFPIQPVLDPYTDDDGAMIALRMSERTLEGLPTPSVEILQAIARAGSNNPRTIDAIITNLRDLATVDPSSYDVGGNYQLAEALDWLGLSEDGLTAQAREYIVVLLKEMGGQAGERAMCDRMNEPGGMAHTEHLLMSKGLIALTRQGRTLTAAGIRRAQKETP